jgi:hypothetical protein
MKRAREDSVDASGQLGGQGETACVVLPAHHHHQTKRRRGELVDNDDDDEEGGLEWNLLRDLPYVAFRRLLDFLSPSEGPPPRKAARVPELCRVRAERAVRW